LGLKVFQILFICWLKNSIAIVPVAVHVCVIYYFVFLFQSKLIKLFSKQIVSKRKLRQRVKNALPARLDEFPHTAQFLKIVGVEDYVIQVNNVIIKSIYLLINYLIKFGKLGTGTKSLCYAMLVKCRYCKT
jgi:hypothetical protein